MANFRIHNMSSIRDIFALIFKKKQCTSNFGSVASSLLCKFNYEAPEGSICERSAHTDKTVPECDTFTLDPWIGPTAIEESGFTQ